MSNQQNDELLGLMADIVAEEQWYHHQDAQREREDDELRVWLADMLNDEVETGQKQPCYMRPGPSGVHMNTTGCCLNDGISDINGPLHTVLINAIIDGKANKVGAIVIDLVLDYMRGLDEFTDRK